MDCRNTPDGTLQPSLIKFYEALEDSEKMPVVRTPDLTYLCNQGVLLLNTDLTCKLNKTGSHRGLWEPFQKFFIDYVQRKPGTIFILSGEVSLSMEKYINPLVSKIIKTEHPAAAARGERPWQYNNIFKSINILLHEKGEKICWNKKDWDIEPPF